MYIKLNFQIFILLLLFFLANKIEIYTLTLIFIAVHEFVHILTSLILGYKIKKLKANIFGISVILEKYMARDTWRSRLEKIIIALSGPTVNIFIAILLIFIEFGLPTYTREIAIYSNLLLAIINFIPIYPLDGGRILKQILLNYYNKINVITVVNKVTYVSIVILTAASSIAILYYQNIAIFIGIVFLWIIAIKEYRCNKYRLRAYKIISNDRLHRKI